MSSEQGSDYQRLEDQISWYDKESLFNKRCFKSLKFVEVICGILVIYLAKNYPSTVVFLGIGIVFSEALQSINQFQHNWIFYRSTCEYLKHEKYLYIARSGPYRDLSDEEAKCELAGRVESLISVEHTKWVIKQEHAVKSDAKNK